VPNNVHLHPYQSDIPAQYREKKRWFALDTNLDPPRPWTLKTNIPIFSIAYVTGKEPNRRWLIYAHSPLENRTNVKITIPLFDTVTVDITRAGVFYTIDEKARKITPILPLKYQ
jgi:hypothetical protein